MTNHLQLAIIPFSYGNYDGNGIQIQTNTTRIGEFIIDEKPLVKWFGTERFG